MKLNLSDLDVNLTNGLMFSQLSNRSTMSGDVLLVERLRENTVHSSRNRFETVHPLILKTNTH